MQKFNRWKYERKQMKNWITRTWINICDKSVRNTVKKMGLIDGKSKTTLNTRIETEGDKNPVIYREPVMRVF